MAFFILLYWCFQKQILHIKIMSSRIEIIDTYVISINTCGSGEKKHSTTCTILLNLEIIRKLNFGHLDHQNALF